MRDEWMSTGAMIDRLQVGEVAECQEETVSNVKKTDDGIWWYDHLSGITKSYVTLGNGISELKWRILPKNVSFEEAMKALRDGKSIEGHLPDGSKESFHKDDTVGWGRFPKMIGQAKWTIEGDS